MDASKKEEQIDKDSLKRIIIQLRAEDHSFQEISDILLSEYGILRTRQSIQGMFTRAINSNNENIEDLVSKIDLLQIYQLGYNRETVVNKVNELHPNKNITQYRLQLIIENSNNNLRSIENEQLRLIEKGFKQKYSVADIKTWLSFKGIEIKDSRFKELVLKLVESKLEDLIKDEASKVLEITGDRDIAKQIAERFNVELRSKDINRAINNI